MGCACGVQSGSYYGVKEEFKAFIQTTDDDNDDDHASIPSKNETFSLDEIGKNKVGKYLIQQCMEQYGMEFDEEIFFNSRHFTLYRQCKQFISMQWKKIKRAEIAHQIYYDLLFLVWPSIASMRGKRYAIKTTTKYAVNLRDGHHDPTQLDYLDKIVQEHDILCTLSPHPFITNLHYSCHSAKHIFFVMDLTECGSLKYHLNNSNASDHFGRHQTQFYAASILLALDHIHRKGVIFRDLKLENVLMDRRGYIKLSDFSSAKTMCTPITNANGLNAAKECILSKWFRDCIDDKLCPLDVCDLICLFVGLLTTKIRGYAGTPGYTAPAVVISQFYDHRADFFSLGVMIYRMRSGWKPFLWKRRPRQRANNDRKSSALDRNVIEMQNEFSPHYFNPFERSLCKGLLCKKAEWRLGCGNTGIAEIFEHPYFDGLDFKKLYERKIIAPFIPMPLPLRDQNKYDHGETNGRRTQTNQFDTIVPVVVNKRCNECFNFVCDDHFDNIIIDALEEMADCIV